jgi:predicted DNA-binding protein
MKNECLDIGILKAKKNIVKKATFTLPIYLINELNNYCKDNSLYKSKFLTHIIEEAIKDK